MKYRIKTAVIDPPAVVEAIHYTGYFPLDFLDDDAQVSKAEFGIWIHTQEQIRGANLGDWIIKDEKGEFYACTPEIFEANYEPAE